MTTITFGGVGGNLVLELGDAGDDWLSCTATAEFLTGRFRAVVDSDLELSDLERFANDLGVLLDRLDGEARLEHIEGQFAAIVRLRRGRGTITGFVREHIGPNLEYELDTDQSYLQETLGDVRTALERFAG